MSKATFLSKLRDSRCSRIICAFVALNLLAEIVSPSVAMALTSGPSSPEFSSFEPVSTTDMVNDFTGDFTYNVPVLSVPGPDGAGYAMSLSYHSGSSCEEESSWVGFGWTLNPGAINRNKRGYPDEAYNEPVINYNKTKPNWSQSANFDFNIELNSSDAKKDENKESSMKSLNMIKTKLGLTNMGSSPGGKSNDPADISVSISHTIRYNNYTGFSIANGVGVSLMGLANLSMNHSGGQTTFGFSVNPLTILKAALWKNRKNVKDANEKNNTTKKNLVEKLTSFSLSKTGGKANSKGQKSGAGASAHLLTSAYAIHSFNVPALPYSVAKNTATAYNFSGSVKINPAAIPLGFQLGIAGSMDMTATEGKVTNNAYGYMYSAAANTLTSDGNLYDYQVEKETTFDKHDKNLGIPYNTADIFSATGNNITGGFRMQHETIGSYYPNYSTNETSIRQIGAELAVGTDFQIGFDVGVGKQKTEVKGAWPKMPDATAMSTKQFSSALPRMRFTNDAGGESMYDDDYNSILNSTIKFSKQLNLPISYDLALDLPKNQSSSYINYTQDPASKRITGIDITGKEGNHSIYGTPVYTKDEAELAIGLSTNQDGAYLVTSPMNFDDPLQNTTVTGHKMAQQYASSYLLTGNTTFNYIDADGNSKLSEGDFGGWTKFDYTRAWGGGGQWYRYRTPYNGLQYNSGRGMDLKDQTGNMSSGNKEIYYLKCIETKSHIAFFITNKTSAANFTTDFPIGDYKALYDANNQPVSTLLAQLQGSGITRNDGLDAAAVTGSMDIAANSLTAKGTHDLQKLERIVLFSKSDLSKPLTTTFFEYDYSLCPGIPNSNAASGAPAQATGKLTLKRVWTESNGVNRSQIAPYQFTYEYFNNYGAGIAARFPWAAQYNGYPTNDGRQNPIYRPEQLDAWGNYQENGAQRFANMQPWLSQVAPSSNFDPAAWQLKRIQLPSGGEIHINYEQKDYTSIQNLRPMAMVRLQSDVSNQDDYTSDESVFCIKKADLEVNNVNAYVDILKNYFIDNKNKLYFKVLYTFTGKDVPDINQQNRRFDYVTGYTVVNKVTTDGTNIFLHLGDTRSNPCVADLLGEGKRDKTLPRYVCYQELLSNGGQNLGLNADSYKDDDYTSQVYATPTVQEQTLRSLARGKVMKNTINMFRDWVGGLVKNTLKKDACCQVNYDLSYFKLPVYNAKRGGGIRVKRLLTYDPGINGESGDETIYGSEYSYVNEDGTSSGIAVNEPPQIREENALVNYIERKKQKWMDKIMNGRDSKQFEGPLGENLMPGAAVAHSRVVINNIHSGKSTTGYIVNNYHTAKDHPMEVEYTDISKKDDTYKKLHINLPLGIFNMDISKAWVTQGYLFKLNDMHGKLSSKATYPGNYNPSTFKESAFTNKTSYVYSDIGASIPSMIYDASQQKFVREFLNPGTEEDFTIFTSNVHERKNDFSIELDLNFTWPAIELYLGFSGSFSMNDNMFCQHITSKVVNQATHLMSTTNVSDGVVQTTENLAFDRNTGDPVLTRTFDGYMSPQGNIRTQLDGASTHSGYYYSMNVPAAWMYPSMGPKTYANANGTHQLTAIAGNVVTYGANSMATAFAAPGNTVTWSATGAPLTNVVSASATSYTNNWFNGMSTDFPALVNGTLTAANGFYYPLRTYSYKDNVTNANAANGKIYAAGYTNTNFKFFDWTNPNGSPAEWYSDSRVTRYSPYGYPVEEQDVLNINSSARFGYNDMLPVAVAQNAAFAETRFIDFEYGNYPNLTSTVAHTGRSSFYYSQNLNYVFASSYPVSTNKGLSIKLWLRSIVSNNPSSPNYKLKNNNPFFKAVIGGQQFDFKAIAQTGEWTLYSADIKNFNGLASGAYNIQLSYTKLPTEDVMIDDFRIQPLDASMNCSVYYADNRLAAQFDDQHFAVLYEYNNMGQLVRKSIETERGKKTLQEQQYNTPLIAR